MRKFANSLYLFRVKKIFMNNIYDSDIFFKNSNRLIKSEPQMIKVQEHLLYTTERLIRSDFKSQKLRGVTAFWREEDHTACLSFYFDGLISDEDLEDAYDIGAGIIANFPDGLLEENYIRWDYPKPLPEKFLAYKRNEETLPKSCKF